MTSMKDYDCAREGNGLRYPGFSIVLMQMFSLGRFKEFDEEKAGATGLVSYAVKKSIDHLIFVMDSKDRENIRRYRLEGFDFSLVLDEPYGVEMKGHVFVEMLILFGYTVSLTYRFGNFNANGQQRGPGGPGGPGRGPMGPPPRR